MQSDILCIIMTLTVKLLLLLASIASAVLSADIHKFLLMVASGSNSDFTAVVDQTLEEINMSFPFQLKYMYTFSDTQVS